MKFGNFGKIPLAAPSSPGGSAALQVGGFGKIPKVGDFVRVRANVLAMNGFEQWLQRATAWAETRHGRNWQDTRPYWPIHAFIYRPPRSADNKTIVAGVIRPSQDSVRRYFPLTVFVPLSRSAVAHRPHFLPLWLGEFLEAATDVLTTSPSFVNGTQFEARVYQVSTPQITESLEDEYDDWTEKTTIETALSAIYPDPRSSAPVQAINTIMEALRPFREVESPPTALSVRVPLGRGGSAAAAFWIDVVRHVAKWKETVPVCFWSFDGQSGSMLIQLGDPPPNSLAEIWIPDPNSDYVCDLVAGSAVERALALSRLPRRIASLLDRSDAPVGELLSALSE